MDWFLLIVGLIMVGGYILLIPRRRKKGLFFVLLLLIGLAATVYGGSLVAEAASTTSKPVVTNNVFGPSDCGPGTGYSIKLKKCVANITTTAVVKGYDLHYYSRDAGVPQGYFGPACVSGGDPNVCKASLKERVKHDPDLASAMMRDFNLLPGQASTMTPTQVEQLREQFSAQLAKDVNLRVTTATAIATVLDSLKDFRIEQLSGSFYTEGITSSGQIFQAQKVMNPAVNNAIVGTTPDGATLMIKDDCGFQTVSPQPIPGVPPSPVTPVPGPPSTVPSTTPPTTPTTTSTTAPGEVGKDPTQGIIHVPGVPTPVLGCGADGGNSYPCQGNTATNHPVQATPPPAGGTTGCGSDGNQPCNDVPSTTTTTTSPPPPGAPTAPAPGSGAPEPSPAPAAPDSTLSPGAA